MIEKYRMSSAPVLPGSEVKYLRDELRKIQRTLDRVTDVLNGQNYGSGELGSYAFLKNNTGSTIFYGQTAPAADLMVSATDNSSSSVAQGASWLCLGRVSAGAATLFVRVK